MSVSLTARKPGSRYSIMEEIANAATHGLGALLAVAGTVLLLLKTTGDPWKVVSASIYGASMIILFTMSCLYHALANPKAKEVLRIFDHATIYLLIAGTYTPFTLVTLEACWGDMRFDEDDIARFRARSEAGAFCVDCNRTAIDLATRELLTFCILCALGGCEPQLKAHIGGNLQVGNNRQTLLSAVTWCLPYIGFPRTLNAINCINEIAKEC